MERKARVLGVVVAKLRARLHISCLSKRIVKSWLNTTVGRSWGQLTTTRLVNRQTGQVDRGSNRWGRRVELRTEQNAVVFTDLPFKQAC